MKKAAIFSMLLSLGFSTSVMAANPFSDVPQGHWAYDSVNRLAAAGVIEGYPNGSYGGNHLMTRYEMAQIIAKAMARGADVDKLAAEFADELDALGVRVAALEEKTDNVKITGNIRAHYADYHDGAREHAGVNSGGKLRTRIFVNGMINDNWKYTGRLQNIQNFRNNIGDEKTELNWAFVSGRLGGMDIRAGRTWIYLGEGQIYDDRFDGIVVSYGKNTKLEAIYGKPTQSSNYGWNYNEVAGLSVSSKMDNFNLSGGYYHFKADSADKGIAQKLADNNIYHAGAKYNFGKAYLDGMYLHSDLEGDYGGSGYTAAVGYGAAKAAKPGSFGLVAQYMDLPAGAVVAHTMKGEYPYAYKSIQKDNYGFKGYKLAGYYTVAKNMVAGLEYYDLKPDNGQENYKTLWSEMVITF